MRTKSFHNILVVGIGLIGGSILRNLSENKFSGHLYGLDLNEDIRNKAHELDLIENSNNNLQTVTGDCLVVLSVPTLSFENAISLVKENLTVEKVLFTDTFSSKSEVLLLLDSNPDLKSRFVMSHPIAGSEKSGLVNSTSSLFKNNLAIISPHEFNRHDDLERLQKFWEQLGSKVTFLDAQEHDRIFAKTSHLPHVLAYALMSYLFNDLEHNVFSFSGGSLEDYTRIASSDSIMWKDIMISNRDELLKALDGFKISLGQMFNLIERGNSEDIKEFLDNVKLSRDSLIKEK